MADISESQIARLVLGYLKKQCQTAYKYFLKESSHLEKFRRNKNLIYTRLNGFTLEDILSQYSEMYMMLQARLESTEFFENNSRQNSHLPQQLAYFLNDENDFPNSRESTPIPTSHCSDVEFADVESHNSLPISAQTKNEQTATSIKSCNDKKTEKADMGMKVEWNHAQKSHQDELEGTEEDRAFSDPQEEIRTCTVLQDKIAKTVRLADEAKTVFNQDSEAGEVVIKSIPKTRNDSIFQTLLSDLLDIGPSQTKKDAEEENKLKSQKCQSMPALDNNGTSLEIQNSNESNQQAIPTTLSQHDIMSLPVILEEDANIPKQPRKRVKILLPVRRKNSPAISEIVTHSQSSETVVDESSNDDNLIVNLESASTQFNEQQSESKDIEIITELNIESRDSITSESNERSSHVRALDFAFYTPPKCSKPAQKSHKSGKSLFNDEPEKNESKIESEPIDSKNKRKKPSKLSKESSANLQLDNAKQNSKKVLDSQSNITSDENTAQPIKEEVIEIEKATNILNLRNIGGKANYKRKCNIDSTTSGCSKSIEVRRVINVPSEEQENTVQLPSISNGNEVPVGNETEPSFCMTSFQNLFADEPESTKPTLMATPSKEYPKTPSIFSPASTLETPFTKAINEHLAHMDLSSIDTPKLPITPSFAVTPLLDNRQTPSSTRPTDYSTSSSYYQPSDSEQNKSLENFIKEECKRSDVKTQQSPLEADAEVQTFPNAISTLKEFEKNVIGRKKLHLIDSKDANSSISGTSSSSDSESSIFEEDKTDKKQKSVLTEIESAVASILNDSPTNAIDKIEQIIGTNLKQQPVRSTISNSNMKILSDLEEKRKRTVERMKSGIPDMFVHEDVGKKATERLPKTQEKQKKSTVSARKRTLRSHVKADLYLTSDEDDASDNLKINTSGSDLSVSKDSVSTTSQKSVTREKTKDKDKKNEDTAVKAVEKLITKEKQSSDNKKNSNSNKKRTVSGKKTIKIKISPKKKMTSSKTEQKIKKTLSDIKEIKEITSTRQTKETESKFRKIDVSKVNNTKDEEASCIKAAFTSDKSQQIERTTTNKANTVKVDKTKDSKLQQIDNKSNFEKAIDIERGKLNAKKDDKVEETAKNHNIPVKNSEKEMLLGLKERQIHLMRTSTSPIRKKRNENDEKAIISCSVPIITLENNSLVIINRVNNLGRCETMQNTPEDQLIEFDIVLKSEEIHFVDNSEEKCARKSRDFTDAHAIMTKEFSANVYDEVAGVEIEKKMSIIPFQWIIDFPSELIEERKEKVTVLDNVLIEKVAKKMPLYLLDTPHLKEHDYTIEKMQVISDKCNLEDLCKTEGQSMKIKDHLGNDKVGKSKLSPNEHDDNKKEKKRKANTHAHNASDEGKKIKLCKEMLKNFNVDSVLDKLYK